MATIISQKKYVVADGCGTDGSDTGKMRALYKVIDADGFSYAQVSIPYDVHLAGISPDIDAALVDAIDNPN